jgi:hypothetical protein
MRWYRRINLKIRLLVCSILVSLVLGLVLANYLYHQAMTANQATLSCDWSPNDPTIQGFRIYYGQSPRRGDCPSGGYFQSLDAGNQPGYTIDNLEAGKTYYFSVTFYTISGTESCFSKELSKTIPPSPQNRFKELWH